LTAEGGAIYIWPVATDRRMVMGRQASRVLTFLVAAAVLTSSPASAAMSGSPGTGSIRGTITDENGNPIAGACAAVFQGLHISPPTQSHGVYVIDDVPIGDVKVVMFDCTATRYAPVTYNGQRGFSPSVAYGDPVSVRDGRTTRNIDAALPIAGTLVVTVRDSLGQAVPGVCVFVHVAEASVAWATTQAPASTDTQGTLTLSTVAPGLVKVFLTSSGGPCSGPQIVDEWYKNEAEFEAAKPVLITSGQTTTIKARVALA
jgi:hypothetical protein